MHRKHILVVSAGSIGKRHLKNLQSLGCAVSAMDPCKERLEDASKQVNLVNKFTDFDQALSKIGDYDGIVIGSPTKFHVQQAIHAVSLGLPVLLEKPLSISLEESSLLKETMDKHPLVKILLGYTWRWWPPLNVFRKAILEGKIGKPLHAKFVMSAHLADWHPWERYQDFFMASKELGGGALLDESHFVDLMIWIFGMPDRVFSKVEKISDLEIETDDNVDIYAFYTHGLRVAIHLDLYGRPHERFISVTGEKGTLLWSSDPNRVRFGTETGQIWSDQCFEFERNDMFLKVAQEFIDMLDSKTLPSCTIEDGIKVMKILEACRESSVTERMVRVNGVR